MSRTELTIPMKAGYNGCHRAEQLYADADAVSV
jgi:hypothetical protein